ncbi:hypothetical protein [Microbacterium sp. P05]|uniref:hypothetical protein n=1 Tax=Microbacterium sp. P05 TaxID=3366948 RepID=UPI003744E9D2
MRPSLVDKPGAPVVVKLPPPFSVRLSQLSWVLSLLVGAVGVVYLFVIRQPLQPDIAALIRGVDGTRAEETYTTASDIIYWSAFGALVALLLVQVTLLVSFANRRLGVRWWLLASLILQGAVFLAIRQLVALGERGVPLERLLLLQLGLALLGQLFCVLPGALRWTARQQDVRRSGNVAGGSSGEL